MICHALLIDGTPLEVAGDTLVVGLRSAYAFHMENLNRAENREVVEAALAGVLPRPLRFRCLLYDGPSAEQPGPGAGEAGAAGPGPTRSVAEAIAGLDAEPSGGQVSLVERARVLFGAEIVDERPAG